MSYSSINYHVNNITQTTSPDNLDCSKLFKDNKPQSLVAWKALLDAQEHNIDWLVKHALRTQVERQAATRYSEIELRDYLKKLYYEQTYYGLNKELQVYNHLAKKYPALEFNLHDKIDKLFAVDICILRDNDIVGGIQIKPDTYQHSEYNINKNKFFVEWNDKVDTVFYLTYNKKDGWLNQKELTQYLINLK